MKNIFSRNYENSKNGTLAGDMFVEKRILDEKFSASAEDAKDPVMGKMFLFIIAQFLKVALVAGGIVLMGTNNNAGNRNLFIFGWVLIALGVILHFFSKNKMQEYMYTEAFADQDIKINTMSKEQRDKLDIPEDIKEVEVLYTLFDSTESEFVTYVNELVYAFREQDKLCLATANEKLVIPLEQIKEIRQIDKSAAVDYWHKDVSFDHEKFAKYNLKSDASIYDNMYITTDHGKGVVMPNYFSMVIKGGYEILIPPYDIDELLDLTDKTITK